MHEFARKPYAGCFLFYLLFTDFNDNLKLITKTEKEVVELDFMVYISQMDRVDESSSVRDYFDINRIMKLKDK